jgi:hypothetical protein
MHKVDSLEMGAYGTPVSRMAILYYDNSGRPIADHAVASLQPSEVNVGAAEHHQELVQSGVNVAEEEHHHEVSVMNAEAAVNDAEDAITHAVSAAAEVAEETIGAILDDSTDVVAAAINAVQEGGDGSITI